MGLSKIPMSMSKMSLPMRGRVVPAARDPLVVDSQGAQGRPRFVRMPPGWWDAPAVKACPLGPGPRPARAARLFARSTLTDWGLAALTDDAEAIVGELVANALFHGLAGGLGGSSPQAGAAGGLGGREASSPQAGAASTAGQRPEPPSSLPDKLGLRMLQRAGEVVFAVLDPSDEAPVLRRPDSAAETGRGLQVVDALSDVWGWSPLSESGKAVWAILFHA